MEYYLAVKNNDMGRTPLAGTNSRPRHLDNLTTIWAQIQHFEWVNTNIYFLFESLDCVKEPVLQNQSHRITMTLGNSRISFQQWSSADGVAEPRNLEPDQ